MGKKELKMHGSMKMKTVVKTTFTEKSIFRWFISNYTSLSSGRLYYQVFNANGLKYEYKLIKAREKLYIAFLCEHSNARGRFYLTDWDHIKSDFEALEISNGLYIGHFPESIILHKDSSYARNGLMNVAFRFITDYSTSVQYNRTGEIGLQSDIDEACHDIQSSFIDSRNSDFVLKFDNVSIKAHKSVLYARSQFFEEFFTEVTDANEFLVSDITPGTMYDVLLYMYGGELWNMESENMVKILKVAYLFKILPLKERCLKYFEETDSWECIEGVEFFEYKIDGKVE